MADSADHLYLIPFGVDSTTPGQRYYGTKAGRSDKKDRVNNRLGQHKKFLQKINNNDSVPAAISLHWDSKGDCGMWENFLVKLGYLDAEDDKLGMGKFFTDPETLIGKRHGPSHKGYVGNYVRAALPKGWEKEAYVVTDHGPKNSLYLTSTGCEQRIQAVHSLYHTQRMLEHVELRKQLQKDDKLLRFCSSINSIIFQGNGSSDEQTDLIDKILKAWGELPQELKSILDTFKDNSNNYVCLNCPWENCKLRMSVVPFFYADS